MTNQKGVVVVLIPLMLAAIGLVSTGVMANIDHEKSQAVKRDQQRAADIQIIKNKLADYYQANKTYPLEKRENAKAAQVLQQYLGDLPDDPLKDKGIHFIYWSDNLAFTLTYFSEVNHHFEVIFSD